MFVNKLWVISVTLVAFVINYVQSGSPYSVPDPKIEIFKRGFRFSIPHEEGDELFAFHANINAPMHGIEAGQFSRDILKKCGDYWVFEDRSEKLVIGDNIYFWLFVIRNRLGYRYDDGHYLVKEITERTPLQCDPVQRKKNPADILIFESERRSGYNPAIQPPIEPTSTVATTDPQEEELSLCCDIFLNVSYRLVRLAKENERLVAENIILYELAQKDDHYSKTLRLFGKYPTQYYPTPREFAQTLILEKLLLEDVNVIEAKAIPDNGISFKVENLRDKVRIIMAAKKRLEGSNYELSW